MFDKQQACLPGTMCTVETLECLNIIHIYISFFNVLMTKRGGKTK